MSPVPMDIMLTCFSLNMREQKQLTAATPVDLAREKIWGNQGNFLQLE